MPPSLSARAMFWWGVGLIFLGLVLPAAGHAALSTGDTPVSGLVLSVVISGVVWTAQALGVALLAASLVVRALTDARREREPSWTDRP
jgi:uncharacterized membrane protein YhaH (DUF805 family)